MPDKILLCVDGSDCSTAAAAEVAGRNWPDGTEITVLSIFAPPVADYSPNPKIDLAIYKEKEALLSQESEKLVAAKVSFLRERLPKCVISSHITESMDAPAAIVEYARQANVNRIIVGSHGRTGLNKLLLGSVSQAVSQRAHCTVEIVRRSVH